MYFMYSKVCDISFVIHIYKMFAVILYDPVNIIQVTVCMIGPWTDLSSCAVSQN